MPANEPTRSGGRRCTTWRSSERELPGWQRQRGFRHAGSRTIVLESHGQPGGCAGFFRRKGFSFDVGATTLVDFEAGGVGGELLESIGMPPLDGEQLPGYVAWLPDRVVTLHRAQEEWARERLRALGDTPAHQCFLAAAGPACALCSGGPAGLASSCRSGPGRTRSAQGGRWDWSNLHLVRYVRWTLADALRAYGLERRSAARRFAGDAG